MPSIEDYVRLRQIGSAQQELGRMQMKQGHVVETFANEAINADDEDEEVSEDEEEVVVAVEIESEGKPRLPEAMMELVAGLEGKKKSLSSKTL